MNGLIGNTGFVGSHLAANRDFDLCINRSNVTSLIDAELDLLVCSGLPGQKWLANSDPTKDWENVKNLCEVLSSVRANRTVLISTIDVYQPPIEVYECDPPSLNGTSPYGLHRAWFEVFVKSHFPNLLILRLPGLFARDVRKNLVHDLLHKKVDQLTKVNANSKFQFFNLIDVWEVIETCWRENIQLLNVSSEPIFAQEIADLFEVKLSFDTEVITYDMRSSYASIFNSDSEYLYDKQTVLLGIKALRDTINTI